MPLHHPLSGSDTFSTEILRRRLEDQEAGRHRMGSLFWGQLGGHNGMRNPARESKEGDDKQSIGEG